MTLKRTTSDDEDFKTLVRQLDQFLAVRDGDDHAFYATFNTIDKIKNVVIYYTDNVAVGCGAYKEYEPGTAEIKRMFVDPSYRGRGIASVILMHLESWATENGYNNCILETVTEPNEAIGLYLKAGYHIIPNYGQYVNAPKSLCMKKVL